MLPCPIFMTMHPVTIPCEEKLVSFENVACNGGGVVTLNMIGLASFSTKRRKSLAKNVLTCLF